MFYEFYKKAYPPNEICFGFVVETLMYGCLKDDYELGIAHEANWYEELVLRMFKGIVNLDPEISSYIHDVSGIEILKDISMKAEIFMRSSDNREILGSKGVFLIADFMQACRQFPSLYRTVVCTTIS